MVKEPILKYSVTNEQLPAIVAGLAPRSIDRVLAIAGSGDQAFALLADADSVIAIDNNPKQLELVRQRIGLLSSGNFDAFLNPRRTGAYDFFLVSDYDLDLRRDFFKQEDRLNRIRSKLNRLELVEADISDFVQNRNGYNKTYLSNAFTYMGAPKSKALAATEHLRAIARRLPREGLVYVSEHPSLAMTIKLGGFSLFSDFLGIVSEALTGIHTDFLPEELTLERTLTRAARKKSSKVYPPAVYQRV